MPDKAWSEGSLAVNRDRTESLESSQTSILSKQLARSEERVKKLISQIETLTQQKQHIESVLEGVITSKSWRLTAPLRGFQNLRRAIFPLFRSREVIFNCLSGRSVSTVGDKLVVKGPSPTITLTPNSDQMPTGWVEIDAKLTSSRVPLFFLLYYRVADGFDQTSRVWLPLGLSGKTLARLPHNTKELRLDPFETDIEFRISDFKIRELGKAQLAWKIFAKYFSGTFKNPWGSLQKVKKAFSVLRSGGIAALRAKLFSDHFTHNYQEWVKKYDTLSDADCKAIKQHASELPYRPLISIVMPTYNTPEKWLRKAVDSVRGQLYDNWELCIADDNSSDPDVKRTLEDYAAKDSRIKVIFRKENGHIAQASNTALNTATGEFVALLDHDDELTPHALYMIAVELNAHPTADLIYSDEDKITSYGMRFNPHFKSDWNPDLFRSQMYLCHLSVYRRSLISKVGGFRQGFDGAQDWDLALRVVEQTSPQNIRHIPHVLYHWRVIEGSTAHSTAAKPYVLEAQRRAVSEHLERSGIKNADVSILHDISHVRVKYPLPAQLPLVSIIIPTRDQVELLSRCVKGILEETNYRNVEIIIVDNNSSDPETLAYLARCEKDPRITILHDSRPFNFSALNNGAVKLAKGNILGFLNNDLEIIDPDWLSEMVSNVIRPEIGAVGARLLFPNGLLQHGGVILGIGGVAGHNHKGRPRHDPGYFNRAILPQDLSAVTAACLLMRREVFEAINGFDEEELSVAFNDVDLCLRIRQQGLNVLYNPYAELVHHESVSRGYETTPEKFARFEGEIENMKRRWQGSLDCDPYYNANLTLLTEDFAFAFPPRVNKPWRKA